MRYLLNFNFTMNNGLYITIPNFKDKHNYYYETTEALNLYDEATVFFKINKKRILILADTLQNIITMMINGFSSIQQLPTQIMAGELGKTYNQMTGHEDFDSIDFSKYWLWSGKNFQVWIYKVNNTMYLEVSPTYPHLFSEKLNLKELENFLENYQVSFLSKITNEMINTLVIQGKNILNEAQASRLY